MWTSLAQSHPSAWLSWSVSLPGVGVENKEPIKTLHRQAFDNVAFHKRLIFCWSPVILFLQVLLFDLTSLESVQQVLRMCSSKSTHLREEIRSVTLYFSLFCLCQFMRSRNPFSHLVLQTEMLHKNWHFGTWTSLFCLEYKIQNNSCVKGTISEFSWKCVWPLTNVLRTLDLCYQWIEDFWTCVTNVLRSAVWSPTSAGSPWVSPW